MPETPDDLLAADERDLDPAVAATKQELSEWLASHPDIVRIEAEYNGSGDDGCVESATLTLADGTTHDDLDADLQGLLWSIAYDAHPGFENDSGGRGTIVIAGGKVRIVHAWFVEITEDDAVIEWAVR